MWALSKRLSSYTLMHTQYTRRPFAHLFGLHQLQRLAIITDSESTCITCALSSIATQLHFDITHRAPVIDFLIAQRRPTPNALLLIIKHLVALCCEQIFNACDGNWTTRGYANSRNANSRIGHLVDWSTYGLDNSRSRVPGMPPAVVLVLIA